MRLARFASLCLLAALVLVPAGEAFRFTDGTRLMPTGLVGKRYFQRIEFAGGCKGVRVQIDSGSLPPGLQLVGSVQESTESSDWRIEGVPTAAGSFRFWLRGKNLCPIDSTEELFAISIGQGVTIETASVPTATAGKPFAFKLAASSPGPWRWSLASGALPQGLALAGDGTLAGTPVKGPASHQFTVRVDDGSGRFAVRDYGLDVAEGIALTAPALPPAEVGRQFRLVLTPVGGRGGYTWAATGLPPGLRFEPANRTLSGIPAMPGAFTVRVSLADREGRATALALRVMVSPRLRLAAARPPAARVGQPYRLQLRTRGGAGSLRWLLQRVRPVSAVRLDRSTGALSFTPRAALRVAITVRVSDRLGAASTRTYVLDVRRAPAKRRSAD
jgi:hypothetical protein